MHDDMNADYQQLIDDLRSQISMNASRKTELAQAIIGFVQVIPQPRTTLPRGVQLGALYAAFAQ
jgi:hypothetical protein